ncbi:ACP phosphodiesterase [Pontibacterium granulatum]|nr:ACP phosphodiesterase [Pontibacterium granulatum]
MNYLAHLYFSDTNVESRVGNLLGDFARGVDIDQLSGPIRQGLINHRVIDQFTDTHPQVCELKTLFSSQRRRFSGIALDVLFDHFLIHHWHRYTTEPIDYFLDQAYEDLHQGLPLMPDRMQLVVRKMIEGDWIRSYEDINQVGFALDRIAGRIRFRNNFTGSITEIKQQYAVLEAGFLQFFPDLASFHQNNKAKILTN